MVWNALFVFISCTWVVSSFEGYQQPPKGSSVWGYFTPPLLQREPSNSKQSEMDAMVDLTNSLGVAILQDNTFSRGNFAFSPYGVASVMVVLYEGARGESARQIHRAVGFPSDKDIIRVGFRDIHRHLRSYFSHEGYLSGISLNKETSSLKPEYKRILRFYGYDIDLDPMDVDDYDDNMGLPSTSPSGVGSNRTTVSTTPASANSTVGSDKNVTTPSTPGLVSNGTTESSTVETTTKELHSTTVLTTENLITEASTTTETPSLVSSTEPDVTTDVIKPAQNTAELDVTIDVTKPAQSTTELDVTTDGTGLIQNATEFVAATDMSPVDVTKPTQSASERDTEIQVETTTAANIPTTAANMPTTAANMPTTAANMPTTAANMPTTAANMPTTAANMPTTAANMPTTAANMPTTVTENPIKEEITNNTVTLMPESKEIEEAVKTTTVANITEFEAEKIPTTTETVTASSGNDEQQPSSTVANDSSNSVTQDSVERTTENFKQNTNASPLKSTEQEIASSTVPETEGTTSARTTLEQEETTESTSTEEITNSNLDNGMLIPQHDDFTSTPAAENNSEPLSTSASVFSGEATSENFEGTTENANLFQESGSLPEGKNIISMSGEVLNYEQKKRIRNIVDTRVPLWLGDPKNFRKIRTITDYLKSPRNPDLSLQLQNGMYDTHVSRNADLYRTLPRLLFLVDGAVDTPVPMMTYTNMFPFAYIPKLHSKALEFPLDDERYKLLIILPVERRGLRQLIYDLVDYPLRNVLDTLKPSRVKAVVPTFMVEGFVILTSSLQKLGIWDVFDPRKANLSGMSMDPELYVRNVEQSVTVVIRNYVEILDIQTRTMAARYMEYEFEATHPFIYFVLDTSTNVALMAGQILDPLNSRIY